MIDQKKIWNQAVAQVASGPDAPRIIDRFSVSVFIDVSLIDAWMDINAPYQWEQAFEELTERETLELGITLIAEPRKFADLWQRAMVRCVARDLIADAETARDERERAFQFYREDVLCQ